jgi:hypothetical protein
MAEGRNILGFSRMDIIRRLILLIAAVLIGVRCFFPVEYYMLNGERIRVSPSGMEKLKESATEERAKFYGMLGTVVDVEKTVFHCVGIAIIGGMLFYILGGKKEKKD